MFHHLACVGGLERHQCIVNREDRYPNLCLRTRYSYCTVYACLVRNTTFRLKQIAEIEYMRILYFILLSGWHK